MFLDPATVEAIRRRNLLRGVETRLKHYLGAGGLAGHCKNGR